MATAPTSPRTHYPNPTVFDAEELPGIQSKKGSQSSRPKVGPLCKQILGADDFHISAADERVSGAGKKALEKSSARYAAAKGKTKAASNRDLQIRTEFAHQDETSDAVKVAFFFTPMKGKTDSKLDPTVKFHLQEHLLHVYNPSDAAQGLKIGTLDQLKTGVKISESEAVTRCFAYSSKPQCYPELPKRNYLVALVDRLVDVQVFFVYSLEQMISLEQQKHNGFAMNIDWRVLEISENLEAELSKGIGFEDGIIIHSAAE